MNTPPPIPNNPAHNEASQIAKPPPPLPNVRLFHGRLKRLLKSTRLGNFVVSAFRLMAMLILALLVYALLDCFLAFSNETRKWIGALLLTAFGIAFVWEIGRQFLLRDSDIARQIDRLSDSERQPTLTALELLRDAEQNPQKGLGSFFLKRTVEAANSKLKPLKSNALFPWRRFRVHFISAALLCLLTIGLWIGFSKATSTLFARMAQPWKDIPPYSPLTFEIAPETPEIFYGDDATVTVKLEGAPITQPVRFLTRENGTILETTCFQDGPTQFAQRLEQVVQPIEFAFAHGKARSEWHRIDLLLEPKVALASITITPPDYTSLPQRSFLIGEEPISVLRGSQVRVSINSNRPLLDGTLLIQNENGEDRYERSVAGEKSAPQTVTFDWMAKEEAILNFEIRDVRGVSNRTPFLATQRITPDKAPQISVESPPTQMMATPSTVVPIKAESSDDLGLARVEMIRTVVGYRDRSDEISPPSYQKRHQYDSSLDLPSLGVEPGETLEVYFQATDRNPSLLGTTASEVSRIQIISEEEYAKIIRTKMTVREFEERFRLLNKSLTDLRDALNELKEASAAGDQERIDAAREKAEQYAQESSQLFELLSKDFAAFDLEKNAIADSKESLADLQSIAEQLGKDDTVPSPTQVQQWLDSIGGHQKKFEQQQEQAEEVAAVSRLMHRAIEFAQLVEAQENLTRRLKRFEHETRAKDLPLLKALGKEQEHLEKFLRGFMEGMQENIDEMPEGYDELKDSAQAFLNRLKQAKAENDMDQSHRAASNETGSDTYQYSSLALEKLKQTQEGQSGEGEGQSDLFSNLTRGKGDVGGSGELKSTLQQMLDAMRLGMKRGGEGKGKGQGRFPSKSRGSGGTGSGGDLNDGYSMAGFSALDIPVLGPSRMRLTQMQSGRAGGDSDLGGGDGKPLAAEANSVDQLEIETQAPAQGAPLDFGLIPSKYQDAVKRYFTPSTQPSKP